MTPTTLAPGDAGVLIPPTPRLITAAEFMDTYEDYTELEDGHIIEVAMPQKKHGRASSRMSQKILNYCDQHDCGRVYGNDTFFVIKRNPDTVRGMDVAYLSFARAARETDEVDGPVTVPPELVIEVRSPTDRPGAISRKVQEYLTANVTVVAVIDPVVKTVTVHRAINQKEVFDETQTLTFPDVLPGFAVPVKLLFE